MPFGVRVRWLVALLRELFASLFVRTTPALAPPRDEAEEEEAALTTAAARCVACGACDQAFDAWADVARDQFFGPMAFVFRAASGPAAWPRLGPMVSGLERGDLAALEARCPVGVPFVSLARVVRAKVPPPQKRPRPGKDQHDPG